MSDVIIIGGSYAGMAAALQLARARRSIQIIDSGRRRNRFASHSHGFLGQDGVDPAEIARNARAQLARYPTLAWHDGEAAAIDGAQDDFRVTTRDGQVFEGRRILLATGVADQLPDIDGVAERWGRSIFHCPYCHGYELDQGAIGVIATSPLSVHQAELLTDWGTVTLFTGGVVELDAQTRQGLRDRQVQIVTTTIDRVAGLADVHLADGRTLSFAGLFVATRCTPASPLAEAAGCAFEDTPIGTQIRIDGEHRTSVPGIFAGGDGARAPHSVSFAVSNGAMAGLQLHRSLLWPQASHA